MITEDDVLSGEDLTDEIEGNDELDSDTTDSAVEDGDQSDKKEEADTSTSSEESETSGDKSAETPPKKGGVQKRFDELTAEKYDLQKQVDYWKSLAEDKVEVGAEPKPPIPPDPSLQFDKPDEYRSQVEKYNQDLHEYSKGMAKWSAQQAQSETQTKQLDETKTALRREWGRKVAAFKSEAADFDKLVGDDANPVSDSMLEIAMRSDMGPQVLYELSKNRQLAERIYFMNPIQTAHEMGKIEARLAVKPKKESAAPDPISSVSTDGETASQSDDEISIEDYMKREEAKRLKQFN